MSSTTKENDPKIVSLIAYLSFVGLVISYILNQPPSKMGSFHIRQALGIYLIFTVSILVMIIPVLGWIAGILGIITAALLWIMGVISAANGIQTPVPFVGHYFQEWFQGI